MSVLEALSKRWSEKDSPFLLSDYGHLTFSDLMKAPTLDLSPITAGDVVALVGDFNPESIRALLNLIDLGAVVVPLTHETTQQHGYFFDVAQVSWVVEPSKGSVQRVADRAEHPLLQNIRALGRAGLVLFSTGTTGRPKAILHDLTQFLQRYETPRPTFRTLGFLLFDHIGGINTLLHTLYNRGTVVTVRDRSIGGVLEVCRRYSVQVLPTTPTFLRLLLMSGLVPNDVPNTLRLITYGTERMDQPTLDRLCTALPDVDFRQTFGMSELGIVRVKSEARDSLWMKIGGEGVETRVVDSKLQIRSETRMLGYLNAESPFDSEGWYDTRDIVEQKGEYIKVVGRDTEVINVGGQKFMASEVERVAIRFPGVELLSVKGRDNPITGQHVELTVQPISGNDFDQNGFTTFLRGNLPSHMVPRRIKVGPVGIGHRFKRS